MLSALIWDVTNVILYRNKWIFDVIHAIMVLLSEMRVRLLQNIIKLQIRMNFQKGVGFMGLIRAAVGAAGGTMADQWKEFFTVRLWIKK
mgnify:CR=1 FL=1